MSRLRVVRDVAGSFPAHPIMKDTASAFFRAPDQNNTRNYPHYPQPNGVEGGGMRDDLAEAHARYPWLSSIEGQSPDGGVASTAPVVAGTGHVAEYVLPLGIGGRDCGLRLTRLSCVDEMPADRTVCYIEDGDGRLIVSIYNHGRWLNRNGKPLTFAPVTWFKIGGRA